MKWQNHILHIYHCLNLPSHRKHKIFIGDGGFISLEQFVMLCDKCNYFLDMFFVLIDFSFSAGMWWRWSLVRDRVGVVSVKKRDVDRAILWLFRIFIFLFIVFGLNRRWNLWSYARWLLQTAPDAPALTSTDFAASLREPDRSFALDVLAFARSDFRPRLFFICRGHGDAWPWPLLARTTYSILGFFSNYRNSYPEPHRPDQLPCSTSVKCSGFSFVF